MPNNIFIDTISRFKNNTTVQELISDFKNQIKLKIFKRTTLQPSTLIKKFNVLQRKYAKAQDPQTRQDWQENERKVFLWFILAYARLHFKKLSEINDRQWNDISTCFGLKNPLLLKYETKCLQKNPQRVRWTQEEEVLLKKCIESQLNGKWSQISKVLFFQTQGEHFKTAKQCRQHWFNHLNQNIKRGQWTIQEDLTILKFVLKYGHQWCKVVQSLSRNRTEHMVKNRFGSLLTCSKKLMKTSGETLTQSQMIHLLIKELQNNQSQFTPHQQSEQQESGIQNSKSKGCQMVKKEQNQNYFADEKTEKSIQKKSCSSDKIQKIIQNNSVKEKDSSIQAQVKEPKEKDETKVHSDKSIFLPETQMLPPYHTPFPTYLVPTYFPQPLGTDHPINTPCQICTARQTFNAHMYSYLNTGMYSQPHFNSVSLLHRSLNSSQYSNTGFVKEEPRN